MLYSTNLQINQIDRSILNIEWAHQIWYLSKHIWAFNHKVKHDWFKATKSEQICFSFFFLSSPSCCVVCVLLSHSPSAATGEKELGLYVFHTPSQQTISTIDFNQNQLCTSTGLVGCFCYVPNHRPCGGIAQQLLLLPLSIKRCNCEIYI